MNAFQRLPCLNHDFHDVSIFTIPCPIVMRTLQISSSLFRQGDGWKLKYLSASKSCQSFIIMKIVVQTDA
jgi:hypothetical protein